MINILPCQFIDSSCTHYEHNDQLQQLLNQDIQFFDKDGYELVQIEQLLYQQNNYQLTDILYKPTYSSHWIQINHPNIFIDHSMILTRCDFTQNCKDLITDKISTNRKLQYLLQVKKKWGIDIDINQFRNGKIYEILHLEFDSYNLEKANELKQKTEQFLLEQDIEHMCDSIMSKYDEWSNIHGYNQNLWKAKFLGFDCSEDTRKSI